MNELTSQTPSAQPPTSSVGEGNGEATGVAAEQSMPASQQAPASEGEEMPLHELTRRLLNVARETMNAIEATAVRTTTTREDRSRSPPGRQAPADTSLGDDGVDRDAAAKEDEDEGERRPQAQRDEQEEEAPAMTRAERGNLWAARRASRNGLWAATQPTMADLEEWERQGWRRIDTWQVPQIYIQEGEEVRLLSHNHGWFMEVAGQDGWNWIQRDVGGQHMPAASAQF